MPDKRCIQDFDLVKDYIVYRLINPDRNKKLLEDVPHISFLDLSIVFHCLSEKEQICTSSNLICNAHFAQWGVPLDMLYEAASVNTQRILGYDIQTMHSVMCEMMRENPEKFDGVLLDKLEKGNPIFVISNNYRTEGAACMLYPKLIGNIARTLGNNIYIIPSSVNELLLLSAISDAQGIQIRRSIREINDTGTKPEMILSYSLYYYDRGADKIMIY